QGAARWAEQLEGPDVGLTGGGSSEEGDEGPLGQRVAMPSAVVSSRLSVAVDDCPLFVGDDDPLRHLIESGGQTAGLEVELVGPIAPLLDQFDDLRQQLVDTEPAAVDLVALLEPVEGGRKAAGEHRPPHRVAPSPTNATRRRCRTG